MRRRRRSDSLEGERADVGRGPYPSGFANPAAISSESAEAPAAVR